MPTKYIKKVKKVYGEQMPTHYSQNYQIIWLAEKYAKTRTVSPAAIIRDVCKVFELHESQLKDKCRVSEILIPRQIAMYLCRKVTGRNYDKLAEEFDRDHTVIMHAVRKSGTYLKNNDTMFMGYWNRYQVEGRYNTVS